MQFLSGPLKKLQGVYFLVFLLLFIFPFICVAVIYGVEVVFFLLLVRFFYSFLWHSFTVERPPALQTNDVSSPRTLNNKFSDRMMKHEAATATVVVVNFIFSMMQSSQQEELLLFKGNLHEEVNVYHLTILKDFLAKKCVFFFFEFL